VFFVFRYLFFSFFFGLWVLFNWARPVGRARFRFLVLLVLCLKFVLISMVCCLFLIFLCLLVGTIFIVLVLVGFVLVVLCVFGYVGCEAKLTPTLRCVLARVRDHPPTSNLEPSLGTITQSSQKISVVGLVPQHLFIHLFISNVYEHWMPPSSGPNTNSTLQCQHTLSYSYCSS
jgi:hypothetical protein